MEIKVLLFGQLRDEVGASEEVVELSEGACAADLVAHYRKRFPRLKEFCPRLAMAVNQEYANGSAALRGGDEVALLPPVSGGEHEFVSPAFISIVELTREKIDTAAFSAQLFAGGKDSDGALVTFDGITRRWTGKRETVRLEYEAYEPMARAKLREIAGEIRDQFGASGVVLVHRLGSVETGETSVFAAVSAPHRTAAFEACRFAIDTLKRTVPIWKKEFLAGGAVWAEGELPGPAVESDPARTEA